MKYLPLIACFLTFSVNAEFVASKPIGSLVIHAKELAKGVSAGNLCLGPKGAYSIGAIVEYDGASFACKVATTGSGMTLAGWGLSTEVDINKEYENQSYKDNFSTQLNNSDLESLIKRTIKRTTTPEYIAYMSDASIEVIEAEMLIAKLVASHIPK